MLTGETARSTAKTSSTCSARVARLEPDFDALPPDVPPRVRRVLQLCLKKDVRQRAQSMGDVRLALDGAFETARSAGGGFGRGSGAARATGLGRLRSRGLLAAAALASRGAVTPRVATDPSCRAASTWPCQQTSPRRFVLSPSGRLLAFTSAEGGPRRLWVRPLDSLDARALPGTENADCRSGRLTRSISRSSRRASSRRLP